MFCLLSYTGIAAERYVFENICRVLSLADLGDFVKTNQAPNSQGFSVSLIAPQKHAEVHWCNGGGEASHPYDLRVLLRDHASSSAEQEVLIEVKGTVRQAPILSAAQVGGIRWLCVCLSLFLGCSGCAGQTAGRKLCGGDRGTCT